MRVIVTGLIGSYPMGGMSWHYLQYLLGLRRLGCHVVYLEDTGQWAYDPDQATFTDRCEKNVAYLAALMGRFGLGDAWCFRDPHGTHHGLSQTRLEAACRAADLFINISGSCWLRPAYRAARCTAYLDTDPGYNQIKVAQVERGDADAHQRYSVDRMAEHDRHFTFGEHIGADDCGLPTDRFDWQPTRQPIVLDLWPVTREPARPCYTTVLSWQPYAKPLRFDGRAFYGKPSQFRRVMDLPRRSGAPLEVALAGEAPLEEIRAAGWRVASAPEVSRGLDSYQRYVRSSRGEFSVAKDIYVQLRTGWFSERTACYLASGRPAIVQDTGLSAHLPTGAGLLAFDDVEAASAAIAEVERDHTHHADAARAVAEAHFDSDKVLTRLLNAVGQPAPPSLASPA